VERSNVQALANAILQLLSKPKQRDAMAQAAYERASTMFSWDCIAEDLLKIRPWVISSLTKVSQ
jgi:glycosyltransferase involved in cell wall biosynthesis